MGCNFSTIQETVTDFVEESLKEGQQQNTGDDAGQSGSGVSSVYDSLPPGAETHRVRNVYDGDTLTLVDERRVRFLGIDTPEIKEKQPFAQEAKKYTADLCNKKEIYLTYEPNGDKEDHYGRLLAFVWARAGDGQGYICVNEGIVAEGLARVYLPRKDSKLHNLNKMIKLQNDARINQRGLWSTFTDYDVVTTANGSAFHKINCKHLSNVRNFNHMKASEAMSKGLHPCRTCLADA
mmetsp:Transcript_26932/g.41248  ORF Transcript_26932/g.41248 Transcript_26932/m.41248 type:complete len:236 (-) Transcript_26932:192-899(-)|eukprot:CAMPEP_0195287928 /NCGR_PEP_ID=MMETSP0707-20130614/4794_1 /TAXON_ID=33640 /ORGANISM="Asterionellopsis glacialis, Strain CCMP134" /LENGTH=235 /DNA_ID=CAMNT_0040347733 /DNA_START=235 /DNA_END=942 /DNA_ORIENTATION=-